MEIIEHQMDALFREGGSFQQLGFQYREKQHVGARWLGRLCDADLALVRTRNRRSGRYDEDDTRAIVGLAQIETGVGKTYMNLCGAALYCLHGSVAGNAHPPRSIILTSTIALRTALMDPAMLETVMAAIRIQDPSARDLSIVERKSLFSVASFSVAKDIAFKEPTIEAKKYLDFVRHEFEEGRLPLIHEAIDAAGGNPSLRYTVADLRLTTDEIKLARSLGEDRDLISLAIMNERQAAKIASGSGVQQSDIVVATHAAGAINARRVGATLGTRPSAALKGTDIERRRDVGLIIVDEAENYQDAAKTVYRNLLLFSTLDEVITELPDEVKAQLAVLSNTLQKKLLEISGRNNPDRVIPTPTTRKMVADICFEMYEIFFDLVDQISDLLLRMRVEELIFVLDEFVGHYFDAGTTAKRVDVPLALQLMALANNAGLEIRAVNGKNLTNRLWRSAGKMTSVERIAMMSGTLSGFRENFSDDGRGLAPEFADFCASNGLFKGTDARFDFINLRATGHAEINQMAFADSNSPRPFTSVSDDGSFPQSAEFIEYCVSSIGTIIDVNSLGRDHYRSLVLFTSQRSMDEVFEQLPSPYREHVIMQRATLRPSMFMDGFIDDPNAIWFGLNWSGLNFVHKRQTLLSQIIIPRFPRAPSKDDYTPMKARSEVDRANRKMIQGIGRGTRESRDRPNVALLDGRQSPSRITHSMSVNDQRIVQALLNLGLTVPENVDPKILGQYEEAFRGIPERWMINSEIALLSRDGKFLKRTNND